MLSFSQVDKILAQGGPLYVRNKSKHSTTKVPSILVLTVPSAEGNVEFNVPRVTIPFNICDHVDTEALRSSRSFRTVINQGVLEVVDSDQAERELADPQTRETFISALREADARTIYSVRSGEARATRDADHAIKAEKTAQQSAGMRSMLSAVDPRLAGHLDAAAVAALPDPQLPASKNPRFEALRSRAPSMPASNVVGELKLMYGELDAADFQSIATSSLWPPEAQQWARERLAYLTEALNKAAAQTGE